MRKKILFTIVFVAMTISLTACGNKTSITFTDPTETSESNNKIHHHVFLHKKGL